VIAKRVNGFGVHDGIAGYQFPLCYRCTGLFLGTIAFLVMVYWRRSPRLRVAILLIIPMIVDLGLQYGGWWEGANGVRLVTGLGLGMGMPTTIIRIMWVKSDKLIWLINSFTKGLH
jgi:uncharacterized membrane protein